MTTRLAVVGAGHLGRIHAKLLSQMTDVDLVGVVDIHPDALVRAAEMTGAPTYRDFGEIPGRVDGVIVATPTATHYEVTRRFLANSIPVLLEKPIAPSVSEGKLLCSLARDRRVPFQVGHIERFNAAFTCCRKSLINPRYIESRRTGPFSGRSTDVGVILDLMIHDIDLILSVVPSEVRSVRGFAQAVYGGHEDLAHAELEFENGSLAHCIASRCHPSAHRTMQVVTDKHQWSIDFSGGGVHCTTSSGPPTADAVVDEAGDAAGESSPAAVDPSRRQYTIPTEPVNALWEELREFLAAIRGEQTPTVDGHVATRAIAVAERIMEDARRRRDRWQVAAGLQSHNAWQTRRAG